MNFFGNRLMFEQIDESYFFVYSIAATKTNKRVSAPVGLALGVALGSILDMRNRPHKMQ